MKSFRVLWVLVVTGCVLAACKVSHEVDLESQTALHVVVYSNTTAEFSEPSRRDLAGDDPQFRRVIDWLARNRDGWRDYVVTPAVGKATVSGDGFTMSVHETFVLVSYRDSSGKFHWIVKQLDEPELAFLYSE